MVFMQSKFQLKNKTILSVLSIQYGRTLNGLYYFSTKVLTSECTVASQL